MDKNNTNTNTRSIKTPSRLNYENLLTSSKNAGEVTPKHKRRGRPRILKDYMNPMKSPMANTSLKVQKLGYNEMKPVMKVAHSSPSNSSTISSVNNNNSNSSSSNNTTPSFTPGTTHSNNNSNRASIATSSPFNSLINDRSPNNFESPDNNNNNNNHINVSSEKKRNKYQNSISQLEMNSPLGKKRGKFGGVILNNNKNSPNFTANRLSGKKTKKIKKNSITENKRSISNGVSSDISTDATCNTSLTTSSNVPSIISDESSSIISTPNVNKFAFSLKIDPSSGKAFIDSPNDTKNSSISLKGSYSSTVDNSKNIIDTERKTGTKDNADSTTIGPLIETIPSNLEASSPTINKKRILSLLSKMKRKNNNVTFSNNQDNNTENTGDVHSNNNNHKNNNNNNNNNNTIDSEKASMFTKLILTPPPTAARYSPRSIKLDLLRQQQSWSASTKTTNNLVDTTATTSNLSNAFSSGLNSTVTTTNNNSGIDSDDEYKKFINTSPVVYEQHQPLNMDSAKDLLSSPITNIIMRNINNVMTNSPSNTTGNNITGSPIYFGRQHNTGSHKRNSSASSVFINNCVLNSPNALNTTMNSNSNNLYSNNFSTMLPPPSTSQHIRNYDENPNTINIIHNDNNNDSSNDDNNDNSNNNNNNPSSIYDLELLSSPKKSW